ncbi:MAG: glucose-6-phosphate isomerase [Puniceicoccales bacterium]|jgi:glucose-6-phosphate isomerase|nr:glucose-6-phosphate isomerase [Puniceicoccales bacterium]
MSSWTRFQQYFRPFDAEGFSLDISRVPFPDDFFSGIEPKLQCAYKAMAALEKGEIANPSEKRMVGHYWLRASKLAPNPAITREIDDALDAIEQFAAKIHSGEIQGEKGAFENLLCIGIGGSALGPQFTAQALSRPGKDKLALYFLDNTDPDGYDFVLDQLAGKLGRTLVIITSKSGTTAEPRNGLVETKKRYKDSNLDFARHAVVVTGSGSQFDKLAIAEKFLARFPMWEWVGGRTSEFAPVGLLPAALQGLPIRQFLAGAAAMDRLTRGRETQKNPAILLAASWYFLTNGRGDKDMVVLPYKDRLLLFSRYLQQLVMESLGKGKNLAGETVNQGISVYGNKGSTDQHAYVQQLREGVPNFFVTFIEVLRARQGASPDVNPDAPGVTSGDYLEGFLLGTREALSGNKRPSITITVNDVSAHSLGLLIALFERAVGFYASLVGINAYDQPGVEAGKKAADAVLIFQQGITAFLRAHPGEQFTADQIADAVKAQIKEKEIILEPTPELIFKVCEYLAANPDKGVKKETKTPFHHTTYTQQS